METVQRNKNFSEINEKKYIEENPQPYLALLFKSP
jgi:hypothetical protein